MEISKLLQRFISDRRSDDFAAMVHYYGPRVHRVGVRITGNLDDADDVFQATFMVLLNRADQIRDPALLGSWLSNVASRISHRLNKRKGRMVTSCDEVIEDFAEHRNTAYSNRPDWEELLLDELHCLPSKLSEPLRLCYLERMTYAQVAIELDCALGTLKARLSKGRSLLRMRLQRRGILFNPVVVLGVDSLLSLVGLR